MSVITFITAVTIKGFYAATLPTGLINRAAENRDA